MVMLMLLFFCNHQWKHKMDCLFLDIFVQRSYTWGTFWARRLFFTFFQIYFDVSRLLFVQVKTIHRNHY